MYAKNNIDKMLGVLYAVVFGGAIYFISSYQKKPRNKKTFGDEYYKMKFARDTSITHYGSCHCGKTKFTLLAPKILQAIDSNDKMSKRKGRYPQLVILSNLLNILTDTNDISTYISDEGRFKYCFCKFCGIHIYHTYSQNPEITHLNVNCIEPDTIEQLDIIFVPEEFIVPIKPMSYAKESIRKTTDNNLISRTLQDVKNDRENLHPALALMSKLHDPNKDNKKPHDVIEMDETLHKPYNLTDTPPLTPAKNNVLYRESVPITNINIDGTESSVMENFYVMNLEMLRKHLMHYCSNNTT